MKNEPKKSNAGIPIIIIILVLAGVVGGAWWLYSESKSAADKNTNRASSSTNAQRASQVPTNAPAGANPPNMLGSPTAAVTVEEFADFQCPTCATTHPTMKEIQSTYGSRIKFVFRNYPLPMHDKSYDAAVAAEAAGMQGKFWAMQDQLFNNQQSWAAPGVDNRQIWAGYAEKIGLDVEKFKTDVAGIAAKSRVDLDLQRAKALNVGSTPTILVNGQPIPPTEMTPAGLRRIIDGELQKASATQAQSSGSSSQATASGGNSNSK
jgi:protein-disulfide isomerase